MTQKSKLYFGHPINVYGTELEKELIETIARSFPGWQIENPNQKHHEESYQRYADSGGRGMDYYFREVLPKCHGGIFLPFRDGKYGAGVFGEAEFLQKQGCRIWQITDTGYISRLELSASLALSVYETRSRIRTPSRELKPY